MGQASDFLAITMVDLLLCPLGGSCYDLADIGQCEGD